jgi:CheY-like chemotaxis protein
MARIAISEPSDELRHLFTRVLERLGHEAVDWHDARAAAADAALIDTDGDGAAGASAPVGLPVIVCSIYPPGPDTDHLRPVGHLLKPFSPEQLQRAIGRAIGA